MCLGFAPYSDPGVHGPLLEADLIAPEPSTTDYDSVIRRFNRSLPRFYNFLMGKSLLNCRAAYKGGDGRTVFFQFYRFVETQMWWWWDLQDRGVTVLFVTCLPGLEPKFSY